MRRNFYRILVMTTILYCLVASPFTAAAESPNDLVVFVNRTQPIDIITIEELQQFYMKTKHNWSNGKKIACINARSDDPVRDIFRTKVLKMTSQEESTYWEDQKIRFQESPPMELMNTPRAVFKMQHSIGYALRKDVPANVVKIVLTIPQ